MKRSAVLSKEGIELKRIIDFTLNLCHEFFENIAELLKESERVNKFDDNTLGHLVPLTAGHIERPSEFESRYFETILYKS